MRIKTCSIVGLGKLGACMAVAIAGRGFRVMGVDKNLNYVNAFRKRHSPIREPGVDKMLKKYGRRIQVSTDYEAAILGSQVSFIVVPTPSKANGDFSLKYVSQVIVQIGKALAKKSTYHIVVVTSTVLPGAMDSSIRPLLERSSGKVCGKDFGLCYNPEFIALGTVIKNFLNPDFILIGESDKRAGEILAKFYKKVCLNKPAITRMNFINAELTKISVNSFITTKITFANMLADLAAGLVGGNVDTVTSALGLDSRIGKRYLKGGLGYGGPCFPRDNAALAFVAKRLKIKADIPLATDKFNHRIIAHLFTLVRARIKPKDTVGILGLAYKPQTYVIEESQGFFLARALISAGIKVILYDPISIPSVKGVFGTKARYAKSASSAICSSDIVVIANPDPEFIRLKKSLFLSRKRPLTIIDCWRILRRFNLSGSRHIRYIPLGIHNPD